MSHDNEDLHSLLKALHERLRQAKTVDPGSRALLATVATDIRGALETRDDPPAAAQTRLRELAAKFEVEHPALAEAVRDVVDALGKAGI